MENKFCLHFVWRKKNIVAQNCEKKGNGNLRVWRKKFFKCLGAVSPWEWTDGLMDWSGWKSLA